jgi:hypothetical protein
MVAFCYGVEEKGSLRSDFFTTYERKTSASSKIQIVRNEVRRSAFTVNENTNGESRKIFTPATFSFWMMHLDLPSSKIKSRFFRSSLDHGAAPHGMDPFANASFVNFERLSRSGLCSRRANKRSVPVILSFNLLTVPTASVQFAVYSFQPHFAFACTAE